MRIPDYPAPDRPLDGTELLPIWEGGQQRAIQIDALTALIVAEATYLGAAVGVAMVPPGTAVADVAIGAGYLVNLYVTGGVTHMQLADGSDPTKPAHAFCPTAVAIGSTGFWRRRGIIPDTDSTTFAPALWLSDSVTGTYQTTAPTTVGHLSQLVGLVLPGIGVEFSPQLENLL